MSSRSSTSSTSIRPVTARWPSCASVWEETSLPLACVLKPFSSSYAHHDADLLHSISSIPKCLHCGAPQQDMTHYPVHGGTAILCHLCGKVTSRYYQHQVAERKQEVLLQSDYRLKGVPDTVFALPLYNQVYQLPAMTCPPIWWIVVDGTPTSRDYWNTVGTCLRNVCRDMPPYIHVGLLVPTCSSLAVWDLDSAVPHVHHVEWNDNEMKRIPLTPVSSNLQAALRALGDSTTFSSTRNKKGHNMPLGATIQVILDTLQSAVHPGSTTTTSSSSPTYAGGRILCLLGGPPAEIQLARSKTSSPPSTGETGTGGFGGTCAKIGQRYTPTTSSSNDNTTTNNDDVELGSMQPPSTALDETQQTSDMTASNLSKWYKHTGAELYYSELGQQCAHAALGVDVLILDSDHATSTNVGIPFLRQLSDRSGAPGPLVCPNATQLQAEISSRTPWHGAFGGTLRVRTSPGVPVDASEIEGTQEDGPQLAPLYSSGGLMGPATYCQENGLWIMGCCDDQTAVTIDLTVKKSVPDRVHVDGLGDVALKHAIQMCFAYTAIEEQDDGSFVTVRRMQIASLHLPLAHDTESLYATLDPEALAVMIFHKLTIASLQDGLMATHEIGQEWLQSLLACVYRSAQEEEELQKEQISRGLDNLNPVFYPQERLLGRNGELSPNDVLLAQGHERLNTVPLIVFALLQCDALRPNIGDYNPSMDARSAASAQMYSMLPSVLARCVAPRLELWASGEDEPIVEDLDLNFEHVAMNVMEHRQTGSGELILFVDTPREILVCDSRHLQNSESTTKVEIGKGLEQCIEIAERSYRVPPPVLFELDLAESSLPLLRIKDVLVEDSQTVEGQQNFEQWKQEVAALVQEALDR